MTNLDVPSPTSVLEAKLLALEKQVSELQQQYKSLLELKKEGANETKNEAGGLAESKPPDVPNSEAKTSPDKESSEYSRVKILKKIKDPETGERVERPEESKSSTTEDAKDHAFVLKKTVNDKFSDEDDNSEIDIVSEGLWGLLKEHLSAYPYHIFRGSPVTLYSPYEAIIFEWDVLQKAAAENPKDDSDRQARDDLKLLLRVLSGGASGDPRLDRYFKVRDACVKERTVQFEDLWTVFPPGTLIYGQPFQNQEQVFIVQDNKTAWPRRGDRPEQMIPWKLMCWTYDWTGQQFQRICYTLSFEQFEGHRPITALPYYPLNELPKEGYSRVKDTLIDRGKAFRRLCTSQEGLRLFEYKGKAIFGKKGFSGLVQGDDDDNDNRSHDPFLELQLLRRHRSTLEPPQTATVKSSYIESRVMVDHQSYFHYGPAVARNGPLEPYSDDLDCMCSDCKQNEGLTANYRTSFDRIEMQKQKDWDDEQYMLCPPRVLGYILRDKQWAQLQVTLVKEIPPQDPGDAWHSRLRLADDNKTKDLLFDLIRSHISSTPKEATDSTEVNLEVDDIIPGKGKGLVILLYGPPGVGKTSTAETIATAARKPLFSISVADVGTKARHVEANLSRIFSLATSWQAILLIDEADVFLESRGRGPASSTDRNALVSVFLRVLEYYQGIMFLTTNQIAQFDVAIPSRIHVSIQYESLKPRQMEGIFKGFLQSLADKGQVDDYEDILEWLKEDIYSIGFDGRQIRNIVTTALGLARAELKYKQGKGKLGKKHLKAVVNNARAFKSDFMVQYDRYISAQEKLIK